MQGTGNSIALGVLILKSVLIHFYYDQELCTYGPHREMPARQDADANRAEDIAPLVG